MATLDQRTETTPCPNCGDVVARTCYDIGSGPELACATCEWCWGADGQDLQPYVPFTCPVCGKSSYHPKDAAEGYCNRCHDWVNVP